MLDSIYHNPLKYFKHDNIMAKLLHKATWLISLSNTRRVWEQYKAMH